MRLSIEVSPEQHQQLKAVAALSGKSIKAYVLERVLPNKQSGEDSEALRQLEVLLEPRLKAIAEVADHKSVEQSVHQHQAAFLSRNEMRSSCPSTLSPTFRISDVNFLSTVRISAVNIACNSTSRSFECLSTA